jgi:Glycosyl transferase family 2
VRKVSDTIGGLCIAKNEADIIEPMVRHNLAFLDQLHVVDNNSADATPAILAALHTEFGGRLTWTKDPRTGHRQAALVNETLPLIAASHDPAQIVLLDADEFIRARREKFRDELLATPDPIELPWVTYVPTRNDDVSERNPIQRITHRRSHEMPQFWKTTVPRALIGKVKVVAGSHGLTGTDSPKPRQIDGVALAHFPVRSREQLISKVLIGSWNIRLRRRRNSGEAYQWRALADRILSGNVPDASEVYSVALMYAADVEVPLIADRLVSLRPVQLCHTPDDSETLLNNLIAFAENCVRTFEQSGRRHAAGSVD